MSITSRPELDMDLRHDFINIIDEKMPEAMIQALKDDLEDLTFNCSIRKDEETKDW